MAGRHSDRDIPAYVSEKTGLVVQNGAFGGLTMSLINTSKYAGNMSDHFTMCRLSEAVLNHDFSFQIMASQKNNNKVVEYFYDASKELHDIDWEKVNVICIEQGVNDYLNGIRLDNEADRYDLNTFGGALRYSIENIMKGAKNAKLVIITPIYCKPDGIEGDCLSKDFGGGVLNDYVSLEREIAREYGVFIIDNFSEIDINEDNVENYLPGGLHPSDAGVALIGDNISKHLEEIYENN